MPYIINVEEFAEEQRIRIRIKTYYNTNRRKLIGSMIFILNIILTLLIKA